MVHYCTEEEREQYRVVIQDRLLVWVNKTDEYKRGKLPLVDTGDGDERWIFVIDVAGNCFMNRKVKGRFHHSSFVAGAPVRAAGRIVVKDGIVVSIGPNSGHYRTTNEQLQRVIDDFFGNCINVLPLDFRSSFDVQSSSD